AGNLPAFGQETPGQRQADAARGTGGDGVAHLTAPEARPDTMCRWAKPAKSSAGIMEATDTAAINGQSKDIVPASDATATGTVWALRAVRMKASRNSFHE